MSMKLLNLTVFIIVKNKKVRSSIISKWLWFINLMEYYARHKYRLCHNMKKHSGKIENNYIIL